MKRKNLTKFQDERVQVSAKIERFGVVNAEEEEKVVSLLLSDIFVSNGKCAEKVDHMWIRVNKLVFERCLDFTDQSYISFNALIKPYFVAPDYKHVQGYCLRKVRGMNEKVANPDGTSLREFIAFKEELGLKIRKYA